MEFSFASTEIRADGYRKGESGIGNRDGRRAAAVRIPYVNRDGRGCGPPRH
jgi:hypothetical protein